MEPVYDLYPLSFYNSLTRTKERFVPIEEPHVGMYVCGPTVYSDPHLGHARTAVAFDIVFRYLRALGYRVRYVRNITDVGHLEDELAEAGEDKIGKRARLERLEPMEVVQRYTLSYHDGMREMNCLPPSVEPRASGHIIEQIEVVKKIIDAGLAYEKDGSVYFDLESYVSRGDSAYGTLSGKVFEDLRANTRSTVGAEDKKSALDFALWKRAEPGHIMHWPSPWSDGFPGWHLECTTMSTKYLGERFDIHGGGLDLQFPHHEAEIAQNHGAFGKDPANYWIHSNMLTVNGRKMARSLGNFITLEQVFSGDHPALERAWDPMVIRFFVLQSHYRSTLDFSNEALQGAERGLSRLMTTLAAVEAYLNRRGDTGSAIEPGDEPSDLTRQCWEAMSDDFHTPRTIAVLFEMAKLFPEAIAAGESLDHAARTFRFFVRDVLGLIPPATGKVSGGGTEKLDAAMKIVIDIRRNARSQRDFQTADMIRDALSEAGIELLDAPDGSTTYRVGKPG